MERTESCDALWDMLSAYADGVASGEEGARVEAHIAACDSCARDVRFMLETSLTLAETPLVAPPPSLRDAIFAATIYRPTLRDRLAAVLRPLNSRGFAAAGALASGALLALLVWPHYRPQPLAPSFSGAASSPRSIARNSAPPAVHATKPRVRIETIPSVTPEPDGAAETDVAPAGLRAVAPTIQRSSPLDLAVIRKPAGSPVRRANAPRPMGEPSAVNPGLSKPNSSSPPAADPPKSEPGMADPPPAVTPPDHEPPHDTTPAPAAAPASVHIQLANATDPINPGAVASLADLRSSLKRDNQRLVSAASFAPSNSPKQVTVHLVTGHF